MADSGISLGKVAGIEIQMHWTFIFLLFIALLFSTLFGSFLFIFIVLLFVMVVLHELIHSITAIRNGVKVKKIILLPLGGASIIDLEEVRPELSLKIALAGPVASIFLGFFFGLLAVYAPQISLQPFAPLPLNALFQLLFLLNILLGVFNLVPAFPLDGGRILKSYLQERMDQFEATKIAVRISNGLLAALVVGSVLYAVLYPGPGGENWILIVLWDFIIALFIYGAAQAELASAYIVKYTSNLHVRDAVSRNYALISKESSMRDLYKTLLKEKTHIVLFKDGDKYKAVTKLAANPLNPATQTILSRRVSEFSVEVPKVDYNEKLSRAVEKMRYEDTGLMAVTKRGRLAGILQTQHVESIIALHLPHAIGQTKEKENKENRGKKETIDDRI